MGRLEKIRVVVRLEVIYIFEITFEKYLKGHTPALKGHTLEKKKSSIGSDLPLSIFD